MRIVLGIIVGLVAGFAAIWIIGMIGNLVYPLPSDMSIGNREQMAALIRGRPAGAMAFTVAAWFAGALVGGIVANLVADRRWPAWVLAGVVALASILNVLMIPHPEWVQVGAFIVPVLGALIARHMVNPRPQRAASSATPESHDAGA